MTSSLVFRKKEDGIEAIWVNGQRTIADLTDLRSLFVSEATFADDDCRRIGLVAFLLCVRSLSRTGQTIGWSNVARTLDAYYFVHDDSDRQQAFDRGLEEGLLTYRDDQDVFEAELWRRLC
jgi:hypothetical protein